MFLYRVVHGRQWGDIEDTLNEEAEHGWRLHTIVLDFQGWPKLILEAPAEKKR